jgi:hypothetical protein
MARRSKKSNAARLRFARQSLDSSSGRFVSTLPQIREPCDPDFQPESDYEYSTDSEENSDKEINESEMESRASLVLGSPWRRKAVSQKRKSVYFGNSKRSKSRKWGVHGTYTMASKQTRPITDYFLKKTSSEPEIDQQRDAFVIEDEDSEKEREELLDKCHPVSQNNLLFENVNIQEKSDFEESLYQLDNMLQGTARDMKNMTAFEFLQYTAVSRYLHSLKDPDTQIASSQAIAAEVYGKGTYMATVIRSWASYWIENGSFPPSRQGCHQKTKSVIDDEDAIAKSLSFIRSQGNCVSPKSYVEFVNTTLLPEIGVYSKKSISVKTARIWLRKLGLVPTPRKKGEFIILNSSVSTFYYLFVIASCCSFIKVFISTAMSETTLFNTVTNFSSKCKSLKNSCPYISTPIWKK